MNELVIATTNAGKFEEIKSFLLLKQPHFKIFPLSEFRNLPEVTEDGSTFIENAQKKATLISTFTKKPTLADDSGLEVAILGGRPGVLSARFAGPKATDEQNIQKLLEKLKGIPKNDRKARFRCAMVLREPNGHYQTAVGEVEGFITEEPRGTSGFGYDPIFEVTDTGRTLAEMSLMEKNRISHRALALEKISEQLPNFLQKI